MLQDVSSDVRFADLGNVPSNFLPYKGEFTKINIRPFLVGDLKLLSRAAATKDITATIKAVDQTIDVPVNRLSIGDFFYVLMWHKLHSFPKTPLSVSWECTASIGLDASNGHTKNQALVTHYDICKQPNAQLIHQSDIDIVSFEDDFTGIPEQFDYPRVMILPELLAMIDNPDYEYLVKAAQWIKEGDTLAQKFQYLESLPSLQMYEEAADLAEVVVHGVNEYIKIKCSRCDSLYTKKLVLDPVNFFRPCL